MANTLASEVREFDFSNERLDSMRDTFESSKEDVVKTIEMFFTSFVATFYEDKNWSWHGSADASRFVSSFKYHLDRCQESLDKTNQKIQDFTREDCKTELDNNKTNKLLFTKGAQEINLERAQFLFDTAKEQYKNIIGKDWTQSSLKKVKSDVAKDSKAQAFYKNALKQGTLI